MHFICSRKYIKEKKRSYYYLIIKSFSLTGGCLFRDEFCLESWSAIWVAGIPWWCFCKYGLYSLSELDSSSSWVAFGLTRLNREEFLVTWWFLLWPVIMLPFFVCCTVGTACSVSFAWSRLCLLGRGVLAFYFCFCLHTLSFSPSPSSHFSLCCHVPALVLVSQLH